MSDLLLLLCLRLRRHRLVPRETVTAHIVPNTQPTTKQTPAAAAISGTRCTSLSVTRTVVLSVSDDLSSRLIGGFLLGGGEEGGDGEGDGESNDELGESGREDGASADSTRLSSLTIIRAGWLIDTF
jgi:hypothetical protein